MNSFYSFFIGVRWEDIADILLNSYILFRLYILFRETNVLRVLMGVTFLWFFQRVAVYMGLIVTSWAIQGITAVAALIIIVVFSNEIRSVLQARSIKSILWGRHRQNVSTPVEIIVESAYEMAQRRIGALMVFPGKDDLRADIQNGIIWNGLVSKEMIMSIFWHDNPVHDGAMTARLLFREIRLRKSALSCRYRREKTCRLITAPGIAQHWALRKAVMRW